MGRKANIQVPVASESVSLQVANCFRTLHSLVMTHASDNSVDCKLPQCFESLDREGVSRVVQLARSMSVQSVKMEVVQDGRLEGLRTIVEGVVKSAVAQCLRSKEAFDTLPAEIRAHMPEFPKTTGIPLSALQECFPGVDEKQVTRDLKALGYTVNQANKVKQIRVQVWGASE